MNVFKYIKCLLIGHDISNSISIVETFSPINWIKKCNCCGRYIMYGDLGSICISEKEALKFKKEIDEIKALYKPYIKE